MPEPARAGRIGFVVRTAHWVCTCCERAHTEHDPDLAKVSRGLPRRCPKCIGRKYGKAEVQRIMSQWCEDHPLRLPPGEPIPEVPDDDAVIRLSKRAANAYGRRDREGTIRWQEKLLAHLRTRPDAELELWRRNVLLGWYFQPADSGLSAAGVRELTAGDWSAASGAQAGVAVASEIVARGAVWVLRERLRGGAPQALGKS